jgi:ABC-type dipeptide/oligopeptide/nickel transport system ATPase component
MKKTIIAICGERGSGKSELAKQLYSRLDNCMIIPFAGMAKQCVELITGVQMLDRQPDGSYDYSPTQKAKVLPGGSTLGVFVRDFAEKVREIDPYVWVDNTVRLIDESRHRYFIIPDMRMDLEFQTLDKMDSGDDYNVYMCRLIPDNSLTKRRVDDGRDVQHSTEIMSKSFTVDDEFTNSFGLHHINRIADQIVTGISR